MTADRIRAWLMVAILGLITLGSFWVWEVLRRNGEDNATTPSNRSAPDYYVEQFNFIRISKTGEANYRITGQRLVHQPREDQYEITEPRIIGIDQEKTPMKVRATRAVIQQKAPSPYSNTMEDQIQLYGDVQVERSSKIRAQNILLRTSYLLFLPDQDLMRSDAAVTLSTPHSEANAIGLIVDHAKGKIELLSKVHLSIEPLNRNNH